MPRSTPRKKQPLTTEITASVDTLVWRLTGFRGKSPNQTGRGANYGVNAQERKDRRAQWQSLLLAALMRSGAQGWSAPQRCEILIVAAGAPYPDNDNVVAAHKYAIDAMVKLGLLVDDNRKYIAETRGRVHEKPAWCPKGIGVEIVVYPEREFVHPAGDL
jgi:hypothetical protein